MQPSTSGARLILIQGPHEGQQYPLDMPETALNRASLGVLEPDVIRSISRQHARIYRQVDLYWVEDLESDNGTFYCPTPGVEIRLKPGISVLLLEGAILRLGPYLRLRSHGISQTEEPEACLLLEGLNRVLGELYRALPGLSDFERQRYLSALRTFEDSLRPAKDRVELANLLQIGLQSLTNHLFQTVNIGSPPQEPEAELPPLPANLQKPNAPYRLKTIMNDFITDIRNCFPDGEENGT